MPALQARADGNAKVIADWVERTPWIDFLAVEPAQRSNTSVCLKVVDPAVTRSALSDILGRLKARGIAVLLCGMLAPPNYGHDYADRFNAIYPELAKAFDVPLYPFFLNGVAADAKLNQADGIHPTADGVDIIVHNILPSVEALLGTIKRHP